MKKILTLTILAMILVIAGCSNAKKTEDDARIEKEKILDIIETNYKLVGSEDREALIDFVKKHDKRNGYIVMADSIIEYDDSAKPDEELMDDYFPKDRKYIYVKSLMTPVIQLSEDHKMAYTIDKWLLGWEFYVNDDTVVAGMTMTNFTIFEKPDSIWIMGDYMSYTKKAKIPDMNIK